MQGPQGKKAWCWSNRELESQPSELQLREYVKSSKENRENSGSGLIWQEMSGETWNKMFICSHPRVPTTMPTANQEE